MYLTLLPYAQSETYDDRLFWRKIEDHSKPLLQFAVF